MTHKICLLIDDDLDEQDFFEEALKRLDQNIHLIFDSNSEAAVKKLKRGNFIPDYIFLDINMPRVNGWECLVAIQELEHLMKTPIVIYSTSPPAQLPPEAHAVRVAEMMTKASGIQELADKLTRFFEKQ